MATKIKSLTVVSHHATKGYLVGNIYNGLLLARITDDSDCPQTGDITVIYRGYTHSNEIIFETINAPIEVGYEPNKG